MLLSIPQRNPRSTSGAAALAFKLLGRVTLGFWLISPPLGSDSPAEAKAKRRRSRSGGLSRASSPALEPGLIRGPGHWRSQRRPLVVPPPPLGRTDWYPMLARAVP